MMNAYLHKDAPRKYEHGYGMHDLSYEKPRASKVDYQSLQMPTAEDPGLLSVMG